MSSRCAGQPQCTATGAVVALLLAATVLPPAAGDVGGAATAVDDAEQVEYDVVVYGSTPGAVVSAVAAARQGARTVLVDPAPRVGGMCSGGLGHTDRGNSIVIGGFAQEFFEHNRQHYHANETVGGKPGTVCHGDTHGTDIGCGFYLEPHVAEGVFVQMLADAKVQHVRSNGSQVASVAKQGTVLKSLTLEDGTTFAGKVFIVSQRETLRLITASSPPLRTSSSV